MGRILISEEEKRRILGMHVNNGYGSFINEQSETPKSPGNNQPAASLDSAYLSKINNMIPDYESIKPYAEITPTKPDVISISDVDYNKLNKGLIAYNNIATTKINLPIADANWKQWYITNIGLDLNKTPLPEITPEQQSKLDTVWKANGPKLLKIRQAFEEIAKLVQTNPNINVGQFVNQNNPQNKDFDKKLRDIADNFGVDYPGLRSYAGTYGQYGFIGKDRATRTWFPTNT